MRDKQTLTATQTDRHSERETKTHANTQIQAQTHRDRQGNMQKTHSDTRTVRETSKQPLRYTGIVRDRQ